MMTKIYAYALTASPPGLCALAADADCVFGNERVAAKLAVVERKGETAIAIEIEGGWEAQAVLDVATRGELIAVPVVADLRGLDAVEQIQLRARRWDEEPTGWIQGRHRDDLTAGMRHWQPSVVLAAATGDRRQPVPVNGRPKGAGQPVEIVVVGEIGHGAYRPAETTALVRAAAAAGSSIELVIDSEGGDVEDALKLYRQLAGHPYRVTATIRKALSAAAVLAMSADHRRIAPDGEVMLHPPSVNTDSASAEKLLRLTRLLLDYTQDFARIVAVATGNDIETAGHMIASATSFSAAEAVRVGLAHEIDRSIPPSQPQAIPATFKPIDQASRLVRPAAALRLWSYGGRYACGSTVLHKGRRYAAACDTMGAVGLEPGHSDDWRLA